MSMISKKNSFDSRGVAARRWSLRIALLLTAAWVLVAPAGSAAWAQEATPEAKAAAQELVTTIRFADQFKAIIPTMLESLKPAIVQDRADVARDYDKMAPVLAEGFQARIGELTEAVVEVYARNFTAEELRAATAFYRTPAGEKFLEKTPQVTQQTMTVGQQFGRSVAEGLQAKMLEELRKKGHNL